MGTSRIAGRFSAVALVAVALFLPGARAAESSPSLAEVLRRFDAVQAKLETLSAEFSETTRSPLLKDPIVSRGRFFLTKPSSVLWEYSSPESMRFVIARDEYIGLFPERKRAERRDLKRWSEQVFRFFGLGQSSQELSKYYDLRLGEPGADVKGTYQIVLEPKKRRIKRNVDHVKLWVDAGSLLPAVVEYRGKDGNLRTIRFSDTRLNPVLSESLYDVKIPSEFVVTKGFSGLGIGDGAPR
jgi:outer membrane lipoprotein-sorting protein